MYERSAIVLERYFERIFGFHKENNLRTNYENYGKIIEELKEYQRTIDEEEKVIRKFDEVALEIEEIQNKQLKLHESNLELENERNRLFNDLGENPNTLDNKLQKIEQKMDKNNEELIELRQRYVKSIVIFTERQKERNKYARIRRTAESNHRNNIDNANKMFEAINQKDVQEMKDFINSDKEKMKQEIINIMIKNGKSEKVPFDHQVIEKAVKVRIEIAEKEAELYISIYDKTKKILNELNSENIKLSRAEKLLRDASVKLTFLNASKEYIVSFLDNERMTAINGKKAHERLMEEACKNFEADIVQISNLYELILKETIGKSTKKAYKELYNKNYLRDIEEKEKDFEEEVINIKINIGTVINSNYWRIEGIKNIYKVFQEEVSEKFNKDLSEYRIEEIEEVILPENNIEEDLEEYDEEEFYNEEDDEYEEFDNDSEEEYEDNDSYDYEDDDEYEDNEDEYQKYDNDEETNESIEDDIEKIIMNSRKKINNKKNEKKPNSGIFGKLFKK
ncbi:MAG: hypothetical protein ACI4VH_04315 [Clostridia bacterium]